MRANHPTPSAGRQALAVANENVQRRIPRVERQRPARWSDIGMLVAVAPTLATIALMASYYFGLR